MVVARFVGHYLKGSLGFIVGVYWYWKSRYYDKYTWVYWGWAVKCR